MTLLCRDCRRALPPSRSTAPPARCLFCGHRRLVAHPELFDLAIAHLDCDAFYASVEKRDNPELRDKPVIVGGGKRGVVSAACYVARIYGVHSAMPMFKALSACPDAVVIRPDMAKYSAVGRQIREMMRELTPLVEPLSIDEAFLDLTGTANLHGRSPAESLAHLAARVESELNLTISVGLSYNKFLAKIASDLDKPRGFAVIGRAEARGFLAEKPVSIIWGVGKSLERRLNERGIRQVQDLLPYEEQELIARFGSMGRRLHRFARGEDNRKVNPNAPTKSISSETTFNQDVADPAVLMAELWPLCEKVAERLTRANLAGRTITVKLKTQDFRQLTRSRGLSSPTRLAERIYQAAKALVEAETDGRRFRLIGVGASDLEDGSIADPPDLLDQDRLRAVKIDRAMEAVREKMGRDAIARGRGLKARRSQESKLK